MQLFLDPLAWDYWGLIISPLMAALPLYCFHLARVSATMLASVLRFLFLEFEALIEDHKKNSSLIARIINK